MANAAATVGFAANVYKQNQIFPSPTSMDGGGNKNSEFPRTLLLDGQGHIRALSSGGNRRVEFSLQL